MKRKISVASVRRKQICHFDGSINVESRSLNIFFSRQFPLKMTLNQFKMVLTSAKTDGCDSCFFISCLRSTEFNVI